MRLISELKRRNVLRMAALYIVAAWLVMQVAGALIDLRVLPESLGPWIMAVLVIGFPIALVVSWFFDMTPEGVVRDAEVSEHQPVLAAGGRRTDFVIIAMLAAAIILMLVWEPPVPADEALTVLPFESMTGPDEASFSEGVSIELQSLLAQLRKFKVKKAPEASILARFSDIPTLAREMDVRWVLQGSVRRLGSRVRIAVELIDAEDDAAIAWSNVFDREMSAANLFAIQTEIARTIVGELRQSLDEPEEQRLAAPPTQNTEAYTAYLLGRQRLTDTRVDWIEDAIEQFANAIDLDQDFGEAYSGLADACYMHQGLQEVAQCPDSKAGLIALARKAVQFAPESGVGWISLGTMLMNSIDRSTFLNENRTFVTVTAEADAAYQRGLALQPGYARGYLWYGLFLRRRAQLGDTNFEEAFRKPVWLEIWQQGLEVDPLSFDLHVYVSMDSPPEESLWHARRAVEIAPDSPLGFRRLGYVLWAEHGRVDESIRAFSRAVELDPRSPTAQSFLGATYAALGDYEMARAYFRLLRIKAENTGLDALFGEAMSLLYENRKDDAVSMLEEALPLNWSVYHLWVLASVEVPAGQADKVLMRFREHLPECFDDPRSVNFLKDCPGPIFLRVLQAAGLEQAAQEVAAAFTAEFESARPLEAEAGITRARYHAMGGQHEEALSELEIWIEKGHRGSWDLGSDWRFFAYYDITFDSIRDHPRFRAAIAVIEADMAQQLENVREMQRRGEVPTLEEVKALIAAARASG
jgi:TolB-like protein